MVDTSFQPDWFSKPGDTLLTLMEQKELTSENLALKLGCSNAVVRGLLAGTVAVDANLAAALSKHVGGTSKFWQVREAKYQHALSRAAEAVPTKSAADWVKRFPHSDMAKNGWIKQTRTRDELIKAYLAYFGVNNPAEWEDRYADFLKLTAFHRSQTFQSKVGPLSAWLRQGEIEAAQLQCAPWNPQALRKRLNEIRVFCKAKNPGYFLPRIRRICAEVGIAVVFVRAPSGCAASGATRFVSPNKAMVILSFRYLSDDHFWFTFFHEIGHLFLHKKNLTFIDGEESVQNNMEEEANDFSERVLIPENRRDELMDLKPERESIIRFAYSAGVSAGIVVGQLQHHNVIRQNQMNFLKRRFDWQQIESAVG
jgi:Zn-dependent peptidase ImmA (M78 family)/plasmid maintenance system antidote protein VapI